MVFSVIGLIVFSPVLIITSILIGISSKGSIFYRQLRVGKDRRDFWLIKFRSMYAHSDETGSLITSKDDDRITPIGRMIRRSKIDELPELWNVLVGDMSFVGPRPEVPTIVVDYLPEWEDIFKVRPGITDLATLQFRDEETIIQSAKDRQRMYQEVILPSKIILSLKYIEQQSLWFDTKILFQTVWGITLGRVWVKPADEMVITVKRRIVELNGSRKSD